jgi:hypothetical protein
MDEADDAVDGDAPEGSLERRAVADGTVYVDREDWDRGSTGAFLTAYRDPDRERRYGYFCTNCGDVDTAMDAMGRVECNGCGNRRKPTSWDAAHE